MGSRLLTVPPGIFSCVADISAYNNLRTSYKGAVATSYKGAVATSY